MKTKIKKPLAVLLSLLMLLSLMPMGIAANAAGDILTFDIVENDDGTQEAWLVACDMSASGVVTVPAYYQGIPVVGMTDFP